MANKKEQLAALETERETLTDQLNKEQSKTFEIDENEIDPNAISEFEQNIIEWQSRIDALIKRLNQIDIELTMLCVGGIE